MEYESTREEEIKFNAEVSEAYVWTDWQIKRFEAELM